MEIILFIMAWCIGRQILFGDKQEPEVHHYHHFPEPVYEDFDFEPDPGEKDPAPEPEEEEDEDEEKESPGVEYWSDEAPNNVVPFKKRA